MVHRHPLPPVRLRIVGYRAQGKSGRSSDGAGCPVVVEFVETGLVRRFPTAILATGMAILAALSLASAFILDTVTHGRRSDALLHALAIERWEGDGC